MKAETAKPNVVIFLADDQGWGDFSLHGNKDLATPNIDSLAKDGVRFDRFYVCAVCAPTRAEFLTGRYHPRTGVHGVSRGAERMNLDERTIAEAFQAAGYATGCFGKWHNGMQYPYHPRARGFDAFVGYCSGHWGDYFDAELERNGEYFQSKGYITDVVTNEAIQFIEKNKDGPFFCYVPLPTPHSPMQVPDKYWDKHKDRPFKMDHKQTNTHTRAALAMVENIDDNVGRVLKKLDELELDEKTIVIYFSDNGPNGGRWNGGMKGRKGSVDEGGVRSAMLMRWPGKVWRGHEISHIAGAIDLLPTLLDLAEIERVGGKPLDGVSMKPFLFGLGAKNLAQRIEGRMIYSNQNGRVSARSQHFRLDHKSKLYDMRKDPEQSEDVSLGFARQAEQMRQAVSDWRQAVGLNKKREPRPFTVGHADWPITELPARDAATKGGIKRSSPHPNCSYFFNWKTTDDVIVWDAEVLTAGRYEAFVYYTCPKADIGSTIELRFGDAKATGKVSGAHDPPLEGKQENRIYMRESLTKDFKPMSLGVIELAAGRGEMTLRATAIPGEQALEFRRLMLRRVGD
ncbi:MAG: arylsulfatase [Phycisphaeraceae bacterium]|nr:arylsulfatase [Phycisphaeraceae bacterium]